jgi:hypothetical protein
MQLREQQQLTGTLHTSTVRHFKTPAGHKYYNSTKYSCTAVHTGVLPQYVITSIPSALMISSTMYHNERLTYIMGLWVLITTGQEMSL